jgi:hypothetical protein
MVASRGVRLTCVARPLATSDTYACEAFAKFAMYATCVPVGDHVGADSDCAPRGASSVRVVPVRGSIRVRPRMVLVVSDRARLAAVSTCTPPIQRCGLP